MPLSVSFPVTDDVCFFIIFLIVNRPQSSSPGSSTSHRSRTRNWSGSPSTPCPTSAPAAPSPAPSPASAPTLKLPHVHHQFLHVGWRFPKPAVHDEDRRPHLRSHATQLCHPDATVSCVSPSHTTSRPSTTTSYHLPSTQLATDVSTSRLQQLSSTTATAHATRPCPPSGYWSTTCWVPSSTSCAGAITGALASTAGYALEPRWVDEMRAPR